MNLFSYCNRLLYLILVTACYFVFSNMSYLLYVDALTYFNSFNRTFGDSISQLFAILNSTSFLCVISGDSDASISFFDVCRKQNKSLILISISAIPRTECTDIVMIDITAFDNCSSVDLPVLKPSLYIINYSSSPNLTSLDRCFANSKSPEVVVISLSDSSVLELSSVYNPPRSFSSSSVAKAMEHRDKLNTPDLRGAALTAAIISYPPFIISRGEKESENLPGTDEFDGIEIMLFKELARKLNFTLKYDRYVDWGSTLSNGTWSNGVGQAMQDDTADIAIANIWQIPSFYTIMDFGPSLNKNKISFIVRRPQRIAFKQNTFWSIFHPAIWISIHGCFILVTVMYWVTVKLSPRHYSVDWSESFITIFGHLTMTTSQSRISEVSTRYILLGWSAFALLITSSLSSGIVSRLTLPLYSPRVDSLQQLLVQNYYWTVHYYVRFMKTEAMKSVFFNMEDPWHIKFEQKYKYMEAQELSKKASLDHKLTFMIQMYGDHYPVVNIPGLVGHKALRMYRLVKETTSESHVSWGVRKNSQLLKPMSLATLRFMEVGLPKLWLDEVIQRWPIFDTRHLLEEEDVITFSQPKPLQLNKMWGIFYKLLYGLGISTVMFTFEVLWP